MTFLPKILASVKKLVSIPPLKFFSHWKCFEAELYTKESKITEIKKTIGKPVQNSW